VKGLFFILPSFGDVVVLEEVHPWDFILRPKSKPITVFTCIRARAVEELLSTGEATAEDVCGGRVSWRPHFDHRICEESSATAFQFCLRLNVKSGDDQSRRRPGTV
jgi:hypothetical protein